MEGGLAVLQNNGIPQYTRTRHYNPKTQRDINRNERKVHKYVYCTYKFRVYTRQPCSAQHEAHTLYMYPPMQYKPGYTQKLESSAAKGDTCPDEVYSTTAMLIRTIRSSHLIELWTPVKQQLRSRQRFESPIFTLANQHTITP